jgi:hypothetical protein
VSVEGGRLTEDTDPEHASLPGRLRLGDEPEDEREDGDADNPEPAQEPHVPPPREHAIDPVFDRSQPADPSGGDAEGADGATSARGASSARARRSVKGTPALVRRTPGPPAHGRRAEHAEERLDAPTVTDVDVDEALDDRRRGRGRRRESEQGGPVAR